MADLQETMDAIASAFVYDETSYPALADRTSEQRQQFALQHSLLHIQKSLGRIAAELETADHGGKANAFKFKEAAIKQVINVLHLATLLGISAEDLHDVIPSYLR